MALYLYKCTACNKEQEISQRISEPTLTECPLCKAQALKKLPPRELGIQFKGSGFYKNDYAKPNSDGKCDKPSCGCK